MNRVRTGATGDAALPPASARSVTMSDALPQWAISLGSGLVRWAWVGLPVLAAAMALVTARGSTGLDLLLDQQLFTAAGCQILTGHVATAYSNPGLQSGPLQNALYCVASKVTPLARPSIWFALGAAAVVVGLLVGLRSVARRAGLSPSRRVVAVAGTYVALWMIPTMMIIHSAEALIPVTWVAGAMIVRRHPLAAGLVLGASLGLELWGIVAIPIVLAADSWRRRLSAGAIATFTGTAVIVPFALAGHLEMFRFKWPVMPHTLPELIWPTSMDGKTGHFGLAPRLLQVVLACGTCAFLAYRLRNNGRLLFWAPALAADFVRLLIDPTMYTYYWVVPELLAMVALVCATTTRERVIVGFLAVLQVVGELDHLRVGVVAVSLVLVGSVVLRAPERRTDRPVALGSTPRSGVAAGVG